MDKYNMHKCETCGSFYLQSTLDAHGHRTATFYVIGFLTHHKRDDDKARFQEEDQRSSEGS